eukprot:TRINITY_DN777968_c0_g1_i1.p1 TRINITY_DN777968_c0_g1~~TRINITY_DN777968_c0_g1_i1.p1  ORF type:complete len:249 (+),score=41.03 TRINITY_DN777968_c0_g1_i1:156-902(+)
MFTTNDFKGNFQKLLKEANAINYDEALDTISIERGEPSGIQPLLHFAVLEFSVSVVQKVTSYMMFGAGEMKFFSELHRFAKRELNITPAITKAQLCQVSGFAEMKVIFAIQVLRKVREIDSGSRTKTVRPRKSTSHALVQPKRTNPQSSFRDRNSLIGKSAVPSGVSTLSSQSRTKYRSPIHQTEAKSKVSSVPEPADTCTQITNERILSVVNKLSRQMNLFVNQVDERLSALEKRMNSVEDHVFGLQ